MSRLRRGGRATLRAARLFGHVPPLAMNGDRNLRPDPPVHRLELGLAGMARDMDMRLLLGDHLDAARREQVLHAPDRELVARDLLR